ncbi:MAG TPA: glycosyltransferase family 4 protein [Gemmatimonadales bacterium]|nr:glycosyltransferase family 4 protein [Gemmatimonadales bacterium]
MCLIGGPDVDARIDLMRALALDFEPHALGSNPAAADRFAAAGFQFDSYPLSRMAAPLADLRTLSCLAVILRRERPAIVHTFDTKPAVLGRLAARVAGVPVVIGTIPGLGSLYVDGGWRARATRAVYEPLQALASHLSDLTLFQNDDDLRELRRRRIVPRGKTAIVPGSGVCTDFFRPDLEPGDLAPLRTELGLGQDEVVVTMISRLTRSKGVLEYAAAAAIVRQQEPATRFLLAGSADQDSLERLSQTELETVARSVTWLGQRKDVKHLLAVTSVFVLPSYYREGIPRALLEAAAMGLPLVTVDVAGSRDVVRNGINGLVVPQKDPAALAHAILQLAGDPALRRRFGQASRRLAVERFELRVIAARLRAIYHHLLDLKSPGYRQRP